MGRLRNSLPVLPLVAGLAIGLLDLLGLDEVGAGQVLDVGHVVVLGDVDAGHGPQEEREAAPYDAHLAEFVGFESNRLELSSRKMLARATAEAKKTL